MVGRRNSDAGLRLAQIRLNQVICAICARPGGPSPEDRDAAPAVTRIRDVRLQQGPVTPLLLAYAGERTICICIYCMRL